MKKTGNQMKIGKLSFRPFNRLRLQDVYVEDLKGDTLLYASRMSAGFDLMQLLQNKLLITSVELEDFNASINKDSINAPFNFQFFIDSFASKDTTSVKEPSNLVIEIDKIILSGGSLNYDIHSETALSQDLFDVNHIHIHDFKTEISLKSIDITHLDVALESLTLKEKSGFEIKNMKTKLSSNEKQLFLKNLILQLPLSDFFLKDCKIDYTGMELGEITEKASYSLTFGINHLWPKDLKAFYPPLANLSDSLHFEGIASGKLPEINIEHIQTNWGKHILLDASGRINNFKDWAHSPLVLTVRQLKINKEGINAINKLSGSTATLESPFLTDPISLSGKVSGSLPNLVVQLKASSETGDIALNGKGGYPYPNGKPHFDLNLSINRFTYNYYTYRNIQVQAGYLNDSANVKAVSRDPNIPFEFTGSANLRSPSNQSILLSGRINHARLDTTRLLTSYPGADLYTKINVRIKGLDPEKMEASIQLDSLSFYSGKGTFEEPQVKIDYQSLPQNEKRFIASSGIININLQGNFLLSTISESLIRSLSEHLPTFLPEKKTGRNINDDRFTLFATVKDTGQLSSLFNIPVTLLDTLTLQAKFRSSTNNLQFNSKIPKLRFNDMVLGSTFLELQSDSVAKKIKAVAGTERLTNPTDTTRIRLNLETIPKGLTLDLNLINHTPTNNIRGNVAADVHLDSLKKTNFPAISVMLKPTSIMMNGALFNIKPANIHITDKKYTINNFTFTHSDTEYLKIDGAISAKPEDTLKIDLADLKLETLTKAFMLDINLKGKANGEIIVNKLLETPIIMTKGFSIENIMLEDSLIGTLNLASDWSKEQKGLSFKADLLRANSPTSTVSGFMMPARDSLSVNIDIKAIKMNWLNPLTKTTLFGLSGELGAKLYASGKISNPNLNGIVFLEDANIGVKMLNTQYRISDTVFVNSNRFDLKEFQITDENQKKATLNGTITHKNFQTFNPQLTVKMDNFLVLNNLTRTDSLFYGYLRINGSSNITANTKNEFLLKASLTNSDDSQIYINIPESSNEAQRYSNITFINTKEDSVKLIRPMIQETAPTTSFPLKLDISLIVNPELKIAAIINPVTKDAVNVSGSGNIDFKYDLNTAAMSLLGGYTIKNGQCTLSLKNIIKKVFTIREGGTLTFKGDPMSTAFDVTAVYSTRADIAILDKNFADLLSSTKIPVNCLLTAKGDLNKINLIYNIEFPGEGEEITQKANGLMYSDEIKIKEIANLLAFNTFYRINSSDDKGTGNSLWTSLASSSLTNQLNNLLSGVLSENWSIGTDLHTTDNSLSNMEMDLNVSTRLFDDRVTVNGNFGFRGNNNTNNTNNLTGDFDVQVKMTKSGDFIFKIYNVTNNQYFERAKTTQGAGVIYKKEAKTFKNLFKKIKAIIK